MEFSRVRRKWVIAVAALAALGVATAWQPAVAQDKPAAQEKAAQKADEPATPPQAERLMRAQPEQEGPAKPGGKPEPIVTPGKRTVVQPSGANAQARGAAGTPTPTVELKPGEVPGIKFDTPVYNFGRVKAGTEIEHDFWFTNTGTGPLEIIRAKPS